MNYVPSDEHQLLINTIRDFARGELIERDARWDRTETSCCGELDVVYQMGLMGLRVPEEFGGFELPMTCYAAIIRELAYASPSVAVTVAVHNMVAESIRRFGDDALRREILPRLTSAGNLSAFAISEPDAGSDPASAKTRAEPTPEGWRLFGAKMWVTNGLVGRWFITLARLVENGAPGRHCMFLVDADAPGISRTAIKGKMGIRGSETAEMSLDGVVVPRAHLLARVGDGLKVALAALDGGRIGIASQALGIGQACLDLMTDYARQREQFGRKIADFQAIQWMIADSAAELAASQGLIDQASNLKDAGAPFTREAAMAKLFASETANRVAYRAVQAHGGYGFCHEFRVERLYRDARVTTIYEGTSEIQRYVIARSLLNAT